MAADVSVTYGGTTITLDRFVDARMAIVAMAHKHEQELPEVLDTTLEDVETVAFLAQGMFYKLSEEQNGSE